MALNRAISAIRQQLFRKSTSQIIPHKKSELAILNKVRIAPFAMLVAINELMQVRADDLYVLDPSENTHYKITYDPFHFPRLENKMIHYCKSILSDVSSLMYSSESMSPYCEESGVKGPDLDITVEMGREITTQFIACMHQVMKSLCEEYYDAKDTSNKLSNNVSIAIFMGCVVGLAAVGYCMWIYCERKCDNEEENNSDSSSYAVLADAPTPLSSTARIMPVMVQPVGTQVTIINIDEEKENGHPHRDDTPAVSHAPNTAQEYVSVGGSCHTP